MAKLYLLLPNRFSSPLLAILFLPLVLHSNNIVPDNTKPIEAVELSLAPDSDLPLATDEIAPTPKSVEPGENPSKDGHLRCSIKSVINCATKKVTLSAIIVNPFTGLESPITPPWSTGQTAHSITITPPGTYTYDASGFGCDHFDNNITVDGTFFNGPLNIVGPNILCDGQSGELTVNVGGYIFDEYTWSPDSPTGELSPYPINASGSYGLQVVDQMGCIFTDNIVVPPSPPVLPLLSGPPVMCPSGDTVTIAVNPPFTSYFWSNGANTQSLTVTEPGGYDVTVTNIHGCTGTGNFEISANGVDPFNLSASVPAICPGSPSTLSAPPFYVKYNWSNGGLTPNVVVNQPGTYTVTVTNVTGCTASAEIVINPAPPPTPTLAAAALCPGASATLTPTGGTYSTFNWSTGANTSTINVTASGNYSVTVGDASGCTGTATVNVPAAPAAVVAVSGPAALCAPQTGVLQATAGFTNYVWSTGSNLSSIQATQTGTFIVTVTNASGCTGTASHIFTLNQLPNPQITAAPYACNGQINLSAGNGFSSYIWSNGTDQPTLTATASGSYTVTVTNAAGCSGSAQIPVNIPAAPQVNINGVNSLCAGISGQLNATPGFSQYAWSSGQGTASITANQPGNYTVTVTDANGCTTSNSAQIAPAPPLSPAIAGPTQICINSTGQLSVAGNFGQYNWSTGASTPSISVSQGGTFTVTVTNPDGCSGTATHVLTVGTALVLQVTPSPYNCDNRLTLSAGQGFATYNWSNGSSTATINVTQSGNYSVTVTDATGCSGTAVEQVSIPANPQVTVAGDGQICQGEASQLQASGNFSQYAWSSGQNGASISVNQSGNYIVTVTDANGCTATDNQNVNVSPLPQPAISGPNSICLGNSAQLSVPGNFSQYQWSTGASTPSISADQNGNYAVTVTDINGCTGATVHVLAVTTALMPFVAPEPYTCNGRIDLSASAGYSTYAWSNGSNTQNTSALQSGTYTVTVSDASGCTGTAQQVVDIPDAPVVEVTGVQQICPGGSGQLSATAGFVSYAWSLGGQATESITVSAAGNYSVTVTDNFGCTDVSSAPVSVAVPPAPSIVSPLVITCARPSIDLALTANFDAYQWSSGGTGATSTVTQPGTYVVTVTDANGCTGTDDQSIGIDIAAPQAEAGQAQQLSCTVTSLSLDGAGSSTGNGFSYQWTTGNGNLTAGATTLQPIVNAAGDYILVVTNTQNGCTAEDQVTITQSADVPQAAAGQPQRLTCSILSVQLSGAGSSTGPDFQYTWTTTDGNISQDPNSLAPTVDAPGTYVIEVFNTVNNCKSYSSVLVTEDVQSPTVNAGPNDTLTCTLLSLPLQASVSASSSQNLSYQWQASNGGNIINGDNTANPTISAVGTYTVVVTDGGNGCTGSDALQILADASLPAVTVAQPQILTCDITQISLNANGSSTGTNFQYTWSTSGGNIVSQTNPLQPLVDQPGTYTLSIRNTSNGCAQSFSINVDEDVEKPVANAGQSKELTCVVTSLLLDGNGSSQGTDFAYSWTSADGQILSGQNTLTPNIGAPGIYTLVVRDLQNGCTQTSAVQVTEDVAAPVVSIAVPDVLTCEKTVTTLSAFGSGFGQTPTFAWTASGGGNIVSGASTLSPEVNNPGTYALTVTNSENGCNTIVQTLVNEDVVLPTAQIGPADMLTCSVLEVMLSGIVPPNAFVFWQTQNGQITGGINTANPTVSKPGLYTMVVTTPSNGCTASNQVTVQEETSRPTDLLFDLTPPTCKTKTGRLVVESVTGGIEPYLYSLDGGQNFGGINIFANLAPGNYAVLVQDVNGCEFEKSFDVPTPLEPAVSLPAKFEIEMGDSVQLRAVLPLGLPLDFIDTVRWKPLDGLSFKSMALPDLLKPWAKPFRTTAYTVTVFTPEGCTAEARAIVEVKEPGIYVPNVIYPNDPEGENNTFQIFANDKSIVWVRDLAIFDRWGEQVFHNINFKPSDPNYGWKGTHRTKDNTPAVFVWQAVVERIDGKLIFLKGDVTVVR